MDPLDSKASERQEVSKDTPSFLQGKRVLITGANGFIGSHLAQALSDIGCKLNLFDRDINKSKFAGEHEVFEGDLFSHECLEKAAKNIDVAFHLAGYVHATPKTEEEKRAVFKINVEGTKNLLDALEKSAKHVVFFSSMSVYGEDQSESLPEDAPKNPNTPYGQSKLEAENYLKDWGRKNNIITTSLRLSLVYGPGNKGNIYDMIRAIDRGRFLLIGNGRNKRSMVYVKNVVKVALGVAGQEGANGEAFNVTDGIDYTLKEIYETIAGCLGKKPRSLFIPLGLAKSLGRAGDAIGNITGKEMPFSSEILEKLTGTLTFSSRKLQEFLGFEPEYNLYNGMPETISWYREIK